MKNTILVVQGRSLCVLCIVQYSVLYNYSLFSTPAVVFLASKCCVGYTVLIKLGNMKHCIKILVPKQPIESLYHPAF